MRERFDISELGFVEKIKFRTHRKLNKDHLVFTTRAFDYFLEERSIDLLPINMLLAREANDQQHSWGYVIFKEHHLEVHYKGICSCYGKKIRIPFTKFYYVQFEKCRERVKELFT